MSSEVCPFCGKTYKRLKSHLPHCKAATSSKAPPAKHDVKVTQTTSSNRLATVLTKPTTEEEKSTQTPAVTSSSQSKKNKKVSLGSTQTPLQNVGASSSSQSSSRSTAAPLPPTKKQKQKLSEQIKAANARISTQSPSPSPTTSKPKKEIRHASKEAEKSERVSKGSLEEPTSTSGDMAPSLTQSVVDPLSDRVTAQIESKDSVKDNTQHTHLFTYTKPKGASTRKVSKAKKVGQDVPTTEDTSGSLDSKMKQGGVKTHEGDKVLEVIEEEFEDFSANEIFLKSGSGHQARITLNNVKEMLGRPNKTRTPSIMSQIVSANKDLSSKVRPESHPSPVPVPSGNQEDVDRLMVTSETLSKQLPSTSSQHTELESVKRSSSKSKQTSLVPLQHDVSPQADAIPPTTPLPSANLFSQVNNVKSPPQTLSMNASLKPGQHRTGPPSVTPTLNWISSHHLFQLEPQNVRVENLRANDGSTMEKSQPGDRCQNTAANGAKGSLTQQRLGQVSLKDLPGWLVYKVPYCPSDAMKMMQRGWQWYYRKYIDVKKGGVGGVSMLLVGYCVLSYVWSYPHIKQDRWRKYH
ncbi:uncharacterized protein si:dkey-21c1.4 [Antennarius striatus]|uniref:uncharacterized protein si:dkey-21c1.4 n=1 Tax=Antennarius striatus TaxID=241820 RepID=UPI0035B49CB4